MIYLNYLMIDIKKIYFKLLPSDEGRWIPTPDNYRDSRETEGFENPSHGN